jgi:hypothetical protein
VAIAQARGEDHDGDRHQQGDGGAEIRLEHDQADEQTGDDDDRREGVRDIVDAMHPPLEHQPGEQHAADFRELGGLDAEATDAEPAPRAVHRIGEQDRNQHHRHEAEQRPHERLVPVRPIVDAHGDGEHGQAHGRPQRLPHEKAVRLVEALQGEDRGCAVDHHHAHGHEQDGGDEQHLVRLELPRHRFPRYYLVQTRAIKVRDPPSENPFVRQETG